MGQGCSPPEETVKNPGGPALILAWSIVTDGPDRTLLPLRPPRCTPLSRSRHTSCLGLLVLPSRVEGWSTEHSFVDTWVPALGDLGQAVDLLGLSVLTAVQAWGPGTPRSLWPPWWAAPSQGAPCHSGAQHWLHLLGWQLVSCWTSSHLSLSTGSPAGRPRPGWRSGRQGHAHRRCVRLGGVSFSPPQAGSTYGQVLS